MNVDFEFGEKKHIKLRICSCKGTDFLIERASYELLYKGKQEVEDSGIAVIQGHILDRIRISWYWRTALQLRRLL